MILFTILAITLLLLVAFIVLIAGTIGAAGVAVFGDVIVCVVFIVLIMRAIIKRKRKDH